MASGSPCHEENVESESLSMDNQQGIPRIISMPAGASSALNSATMPLPEVSRYPTPSDVKGDGINKNMPMVTPSATAAYPRKADRSSSLKDLGGESAASGRWTASEHEAFLAGLKVYGREWKKVAQCIPTRTPAQIRSHAQKYFNRVSKEQQETMALEATRHLSCPAKLGLKPESPTQMTEMSVASSSYHEYVKTISENPKLAESKVSSAMQSLYKRKAELESHLRRIKSEEQPDVCNSSIGGALALGPASAALQAEQQSLRKAAKARYEMKKIHQPPPKEIETGQSCANVSLATMPSSGDFDSGEVLALSLLGGSFKRDNIENNLHDPPSKSRKTE